MFFDHRVLDFDSLQQLMKTTDPFAVDPVLLNPLPLLVNPEKIGTVPASQGTVPRTSFLPLILKMNETSFDKPNAAKSIDIWIKIWGLGMALAGLSMFLIKSPLESIIISTGFGLALAFGKRIYAMRKMSLFFVGFLIFGAIALTYINTVVEPNRFRQIYFSISALFYIGLFTFLLTPDVKEAFGSSPIPRRLPPVLTQEEAKWIKFWTRLIAILMILESVVSYAFADWFRSHGLPPEGIVGASLGVVAALGLLFLRPNIGRRFALFV